MLAVSAFSAVSVSQLPVRWTRPLVNTIVLPAHAQTSGIVAATSIDAQRIPGDEPDTGTDRIQVLFDGENNLELQEYVTGDPVPDSQGNRLLVIDMDVRDGQECNGPVWDLEDPGDTNWDVSLVEEDDLSAGTYNFTATSLIDNSIFDVELVISFTNLGEDGTATENDAVCGNGDIPLLTSATMNVSVTINPA